MINAAIARASLDSRLAMNLCLNDAIEIVRRAQPNANNICVDIMCFYTVGNIMDHWANIDVPDFVNAVWLLPWNTDQ